MSENPVGRPPNPATRVAALHAARGLVLARGYERVTMMDIAEAAGVPRQALYRRWPTKQALIAECVLDHVLPLDLVTIPASGDLRADLREWTDRTIARIEGEDAAALFRALLAAAASDESAARGMATQFVEPLRAAVRATYRAAGREGADLAADALIGAALGAIVTRDPASAPRLHALTDLFASLG